MPQSTIPANRHTVLVAIDPGASMGIAIYYPSKPFQGKAYYERIFTSDFWGAIDTIDTYRLQFDGSTAGSFAIVVENPNLNKPVFMKNGVSEDEIKKRLKVGQDVGKNKRDAQLIIAYCEKKKIPYYTVRPRTSKLKSVKVFQKMTGYTGSTSQHGRDAALLVLGL